MALTGVKGPDRVLYALSGYLQNKLPSVINTYNSNELCSALFTVPNGIMTISEVTNLKYKYNNADYSIEFIAGNYSLNDIKTKINQAGQPLVAKEFSDYAILLCADQSLKFLSAFGNLRTNQSINYRPLVLPNNYIISEQLPGEDQIKLYPTIGLELNSIQPDESGIVTSYEVNLVLAITSPINTSQSDYLSSQLMKYYDCLSEVLLENDGSLGGIVNGVNINNANIDEATGNSNYLKLLSISLTIAVEED